MIGESYEADYPMPSVSPSAAQADRPGGGDRGVNNVFDTARAARSLNGDLSLAGISPLSWHPSTSTLFTSSVVPDGALTSPNFNTQNRTFPPHTAFIHHEPSLVDDDDFNTFDDPDLSSHSFSHGGNISGFGANITCELDTSNLTLPIQRVTQPEVTNTLELLFPEEYAMMRLTASPPESLDDFASCSSIQSFNSPPTPADEICLDIGMNHPTSGQVLDLPYFPTTSRSDGSYCQIPPATSYQIPTYPQNDAYASYNWMSAPLLAQNNAAYQAPPNNVYSTFETGYSSSSTGQPMTTITSANAYPTSYTTTMSSDPHPQPPRLPHSNSQPTVPTRSSLAQTPPSNTYPNHRQSLSFSQNSLSRSTTTSPNPNPSHISNVHTGKSSLNSTSSTSLDPISIPLPDGSRRCSYPGCTSRALFTRGCDLRKHYARHQKHLYCTVDPACPQSAASCANRKDGGGGFSSNKDRARHEAKHDPRIRCEWRGKDARGVEVRCDRVFSRTDNMKDHVRRIHVKGEREKERDRDRDSEPRR